jgi:recombinational DNA repair ATPase RecF
MEAFIPRLLHLQTIESLFAELIGGERIGIGTDGETFGLETPRSKAVLDWYRRNRPKWPGNVAITDIEAICDYMATTPPVLPVPEIVRPDSARRLKLVKVVAHRFAGIHAYGEPGNPPEDFTFEPHEPATLFEGWNGAGKTSLLNAIVWCLTGEILRPQRPPESALHEFDATFSGMSSDSDGRAHTIPPVTPLPDGQRYKPGPNERVPIDTWVELTFADQTGAHLPPIRRQYGRSQRGKLEEVPPNVSPLKVDPAALRVGTVMPAILQYLQIGDASDLGRAVAQLTGLAELSDLAKHASKARDKLKGEMRKAREAEIAEADKRFSEARSDLKDRIAEFTSMAYADPIPEPSGAAELEQQLAALEEHFTGLKTNALKAARAVLGDTFDPTQKAARDDLEKSIGPALGQLQTIGELSSARRLKALATISDAEWQKVDGLIAQLHQEAAVLAELNQQPDIARRKQLYARVASWSTGQNGHDFSVCDVCSRSLDGVIDPVTKRAVAEHLDEVAREDHELLSMTELGWVAKWTGLIAEQIPAALISDIAEDLPNKPIDLMRTTFVDELFTLQAFAKTLSALKPGVATLCDKTFAGLPGFDEPDVPSLPLGAVAKPLLDQLSRLVRARAFAMWRTKHDAAVKAAVRAILGSGGSSDARISETSPIGARLNALDSTVKGTAPINAALLLCARMKEALQARRTKEARLALYIEAQAALEPAVALGGLAEAQVASLQNQLHARALYWRKQCYQNAYNTAGHDMRETAMSIKGVIEIQVGSEHSKAPAQHVSNASALRASLVGFYLAFWEHVLKSRGGLQLLILDDPQELLDQDNRRLLAGMLHKLIEAGAQLFIATYDRGFADDVVSALRQHSSVEHLSVHPVNVSRERINLSVAVDELDEKRQTFLRDTDNARAAQDYARAAREFIEARLRDIFDDPAYPAYSSPVHRPALGDLADRLRGLVRNPPVALFKYPAMRAFCNHSGMAQRSECLGVLNTAHHNSSSLSAGAVGRVAQDIQQLTKIAEQIHGAFRQWRWREPLEDAVPRDIVALSSLHPPLFRALIHPDLAAFTASSGHDVTQDIATDVLSGEWFADKSLFHIKTENFGFAIPSGRIAIVESVPYGGQDHHLVIANDKGNMLARRLLRPPGSADFTLAAEAPDPRSAKPTLMFAPGGATLYKVVGMLVEQTLPPPGKGEAVELASAHSLDRIVTAYRVREDSAIPLALPGQVVLGGDDIPANRIGTMEGQLVALTLADGAGVFKRVGPALASPLSSLRQFESIGGLGDSLIVCMAADGHPDLPTFASARVVLGVLYSA